MKKLLLFLLAVIILASAVLTPFLIERHRAEKTRRTVTLAITYEDITVLAQGSGLPAEDWLRELREMGLGLIFVNEDQYRDGTLTGLFSELGLPVGTLGFAPKEIPVYIPSEDAVKSDAGEGTAVGLVENVERMGANLPPSFDYGSIKGRAVRILNLWKPYSRSYAASGYEPGEEVANILFRAVTERTIQIILLKPMLHRDNTPVLEVEEYRRMLKRFTGRLSSYGLGLSDYRLQDSPWFSTGSSAEPGSLRPDIPDLLLIVIAFGISVFFPCLAIFVFHWMIGRQGRKGGKKPSLFSALGRFYLILIVTAGICIIGGLWIGAVLGSGAFMLEIRHFRGVKLSLILPVMFSLIWYFRYHTKGNSLIEDLRDLRKQIKIPGWAVIAILAALVIAVAIFIYRTGDVAIRASAPERFIRDTMENLFYARPRTKEALFALPLLSLAALLSVFNRKKLMPVLGTCASIGFGSIANTFCHISAPLTVSAARTLGGVLTAAILGTLFILLVFLIRKIIGLPVRKNEQ